MRSEREAEIWKAFGMAIATSDFVEAHRKAVVNRMKSDPAFSAKDVPALVSANEADYAAVVKVVEDARTADGCAVELFDGAPAVPAAVELYDTDDADVEPASELY